LFIFERPIDFIIIPSSQINHDVLIKKEVFLIKKNQKTCFKEKEKEIQKKRRWSIGDYYNEEEEKTKRKKTNKPYFDKKT